MRRPATFGRLGETLSRRGAGRSASRVYEKDYYAFDGGLNTEDGPLAIPLGDIIGSKNYEPNKRGGFRRVDGHERFDGRPAPAEQHYTFILFDAGVPADYPIVGDTINGQTSGATGRVLSIGQGSPYTDGFDSGFGADDNIGYVALINVTGTFQDNENLREVTTVFGVEYGAPIVDDAVTDALHEILVDLMEAYFRTLVLAVPGSGPVRGVWFFKGVTYAWRDNAGATACVMHKSTGSGWSAIVLNKKIRFDAGVGQIFEGDTVTGLTSGATGVVLRVGTVSGTWGGTMVGYLVFVSITGTFVDNEGLQVGGVTKATANGAAFVQSLTAGGRYEFRTNNYFGHSDKIRFYGVNGEDACFEYDPVDACFAQIDTGMTVDKPRHIGSYSDILMLAFSGGSVQLAGRNTPMAWTVVRGAGELALGEEVVGFIEEIGATDNVAVFILGRNRISRLSGTTPATFKLVEFGIRAGCREWSSQRIANGIYLDDQGFTTLTATEAHGNFRESIVTDKAAGFITKLLGRSSVVDSHVSRELSLYRCSFANGDNVVIGYKDVYTKGGAPTREYRVMVTNYGKPVLCSCEQEGLDGRIRTFFGSDDGFVYEIRSDVRSFDGVEVESFVRMPYHFSKSPQRHKRYRRGTIDIKTASRMLTMKCVVDYMSGNPDYNMQPVIDMVIPGGGGFWDISDWGEFQWSSEVNPTATFALNASGTNISVGAYSKTKYELTHTLLGLTLHYSPRKLNRNSLA